MELYINSAGIVSSGGSNTIPGFLAAAPEYHTDRLYSIEPDYKPYIPLMQLRRMSKAVRMSIAASKYCMEQAGIEKPDAISVGTAVGCIQDSEIFISKMLDQDEQMLTPTAFIQSTHNTVAGQIALLSGCNGHNLTFVHRGHSFEHALIDAQLYVDEHPEAHVLAGGIDELIDISFAIFHKAGIYKKELSTPADVLNRSATPGSIAGEGAAFFSVSDKPVSDEYLCVKDICLFVTKDNAKALENIDAFLQQHHLDGNIDFVMLGVNGDSQYASFYDTLRSSVFKDVSQVAFKHLSGEYPTVSSYALGLLQHAVKNREFPEFTVLNKQPAGFKRFLLINNYIHYYSCWLIEAN
jgi:3-oxoacyl-[acyl-carrier-protein] synthase II